MKENLTELVFILDKSGSMSGLEADTIGGYNALLAQNREAEGDAVVSTVMFDSSVRVVHDRVPIAEVQPLGPKDYVPGGCTALLDAVGGAIRYHERVQKILPEEYRPARTLFCITTDGMENSSCRYTYHRVKSMIGAAKKRGWEFLFLAANIDVEAEADRLGIDRDCAVAYDATPDGCAMAMEEIRCASAAVRGGCRVSERHAC